MEILCNYTIVKKSVAQNKDVLIKIMIIIIIIIIINIHIYIYIYSASTIPYSKALYLCHTGGTKL